MRQKRILFTAACILAAVGAMAQGNGQAGITEATQMVTSYFEPGTKLIYAIGAVVGLIGGVKVYGKFSSGDPDTSKTAASWFGACRHSQASSKNTAGIFILEVSIDALRMSPSTRVLSSCTLSPSIPRTYSLNLSAFLFFSLNDSFAV